MQEFMVDEYVDWINRRSSLKLLDKASNKFQILYNEFKESSSRRLISYEVDSNTCTSMPINGHPLFSLRALSIMMIPSEKLSSELCDIALGPTSLLVAVEQSLDKFNFLRTEFISSRLIQADLYIRKLEDAVKSSNNYILVRITASKFSKADKTLQDLPGVVDIVSIQQCVKKKAIPSSKYKDFECSKDELVMDNNYYVTTSMTIGSTIGRPLKENDDFDFNRDPFMQPVGIGCWDESAVFLGHKSFNAPTLQFSTEYMTEGGNPDSSFMAYDGYHDLLRIDEMGRKSIYDLSRELSYHIGEFSSIKEITNSPDRAKDCIVVPMSDWSMKKKRLNMIERTLGIGRELDRGAHYLGARAINHVEYNVYEKELRFSDPGFVGYNLPIILQSTRYPLAPYDVSSKTRYFVTYYVEESFNKPSVFAVKFGESEPPRVMMIPKYVELWEYSVELGKKSLINRAHLLQFSWSLEVEPFEDPDSNDLSRLFNIESCAQDRSSQMQLRYIMRGASSEDFKDNRKFLDAFHSNKQFLKGLVHENLASALDISRLNIAHVDLSFVEDPPSIMVDSRIVELRSGVAVNKWLGYVKLADLRNFLPKESIVDISYNRHTLDSCYLDSLNQKVENSIVFCKGVTICVLVNRIAMEKFDDKLIVQAANVELLWSKDMDKTVCSLNRFDWATSPKDVSDTSLTTATADEFRLKSKPFEVTFKFTEPEESIFFRGVVQDVNARILDKISFIGTNSPLAGIRFLAPFEDSDSGYANMKLSDKIDGFRRCQLACDFDEFCGSFSICSHKRSPSQPTDCILSTLRLSRDYLSQLNELLDPSPDQGPIVSGEFGSEQYKFMRDLDCSIHPKDIMSSYKVIESHEGAIRPPSDSSHGTYHYEIESPDECAGKAYEVSLSSNALDSKFTYCPLSSICYLGPGEVKDLGISQKCFVYSRSHSQYYDVQKHARFSIKVSGGNDIWMNSSQMKESKVGRWIEGLSLEQCARDCNLRHSGCLAFDSCTSMDHKLCILYRIRSPMTKANRKLGYLPQEKQFYPTETPNGSASLAGFHECDHYALRATFFDIRLQQLLENEGPTNKTLVDKLEELTLSEDDRRDQLFLDELNANKKKVPPTETKNEGGHPLALLMLIGFAIGSLSFLYSDKAFYFISDRIQYIKARRDQRNRGPRISQVAIANNLEL